MNAHEWLASRREVLPPELRSAVADALGEQGSSDGDDSAARVSSEFLSAAAAVLPRVLRNGCGERSGALDLLTLDALVTYAMEAGVECGSAADCERAAWDMLRILGKSSPEPASRE